MHPLLKKILDPPLFYVYKSMAIEVLMREFSSEF